MNRVKDSIVNLYGGNTACKIRNLFNRRERLALGLVSTRGSLISYPSSRVSFPHPEQLVLLSLKKDHRKTFIDR
jgi:hypothetical protein